jgi:Holliday junction resolvase RusA-like endonuclease
MTIPVYYTYRSKGKSHTVLVGLNQIYNMHYMVRSKMVKHFHHIISAKLKAVPVQGKVKTHYTYFYKNSQSDAPNVVSGIDKLFMDALQEVGVIKDDNVLNYIGSTWEVGGQDKVNPRIEVKLIEIFDES